MKKRGSKSGLIQVGLCLAIAVSGLAGLLFGTSILENVHLSYIRAQARNVVKLVNERGGGGTGFIVKGASGQVYILTNDHICKGSETGYLKAYYQGDAYVVKIVKQYDFNDLCAVEAPTTTSGNFWIARSVDLGERIYTIGHPLLEPTSISQGEFSNLVTILIQTGMNVEPKECSGKGYELLDLADNPIARMFGIMNVCLRHLVANPSTATILPGNSGSPTVNIYGNVVGVVFAGNESGVRSYHVPLEDIKDFLSTL